MPRRGSNVIVKFSRTNAYNQDKLDQQITLSLLHNNAQRRSRGTESLVPHSEGLQSEGRRRRRSPAP